MLEDFLAQAFSGGAKRRAPLPEDHWKPFLEDIWGEDTFHGELVAEGDLLRVVALGEEALLEIWGGYARRLQLPERSWKRKPLLEAFPPVGRFALERFSYPTIETLLEGVRLWAQASGFRFPHPKTILSSLGEKPSGIWLSPSLRLLVLFAQGKRLDQLKISTATFSPHGGVVAPAEGPLAARFRLALAKAIRELKPFPEEEVKHLLGEVWRNSGLAPDPKVVWGVLEGKVPEEVLGL